MYLDIWLDKTDVGHLGMLDNCLIGTGLLWKIRGICLLCQVVVLFGHLRDRDVLFGSIEEP